MNRLHHIQETFIKNIEDNISQNPEISVEFILLDYNSTDSLMEWAKTNIAKYISEGKVKYYRTEEPVYFDRSHSRNMAFKVATGDVLCNVDADNFLGKNFVDYLYDKFQSSNKSFFTPAFSQRDIIGKLCINRKEFLNNRGYNETMIGYGFEDLEFYARLRNSGMKHEFIDKYAFLHAIKHSHEERYKNEPLGKEIESIYVGHINPWTSSVYFFNKKGVLIHGTVINNELLRLKYKDKFVQVENHDIFLEFLDKENLITLQDDWKVGSWNYTEKGLSMIESGSIEIKMQYSNSNRNEMHDLYINKRIKKVNSKKLIMALVLLKTELTNRTLLNSALLNKDLEQVNQIDFGCGLVKLNFGENTIAIP